MTNDRLEITARQIQKGDFIVSCDRWPNGRTIIGVWNDCGIEIMFNTCGTEEYFSERLDSKKTKVAISKTFSDRFNR